MDFTLLICTHDRSGELADTLTGLYSLDLPAGTEWELLVIDNASPTPVAEALAPFRDRLPVRCIRETRPGKSHALDTGIRAALAPLILLTDDDVTVAPNWAAAMCRAAASHPDCTFFGGPVQGAYDERMPPWMRRSLPWLRCHPRVEAGPLPFRVEDPARVFFIGANMAFRTAPAISCPHNPDLGPRGSDRERVLGVGGEERDFQRKLLRAGGKGLYVPDARVFHRDPPHRFSAAFVREWYFRNGESAVISGDEPRNGPGWFGAPRHLWKRFLLHFGLALAQYPFSRILPPERWLRNQARAAETLGMIGGFRRMSRREPHPHLGP